MTLGKTTLTFLSSGAPAGTQLFPALQSPPPFLFHSLAWPVTAENGRTAAASDPRSSRLAPGSAADPRNPLMSDARILFMASSRHASASKAPRQGYPPRAPVRAVVNDKTFVS